MMPTVSLVLLQHNLSHFTEAAYKSIMGGSLVPDEVILVDNGSLPEHREWYQPWLHRRLTAKSSSGFVRTSAIELPENLNYVLGMNAGWKQATGDYVVLATNDIRLTHNCLENLIASVQLDERIGYLSAVYLQGPWANAVANVPDAAKVGVPDDMTVLDRYCATLKPAYVPVEVTEATLVVVPKRVSDEVGYWWDELISWHTHDYSWRLRQAGYLTAVCPGAVFWHHPGHPTLASLAWNFGKADRYSEGLIRNRWPGGCPPLRAETHLPGTVGAVSPKDEPIPGAIISAESGFLG